MIRRRSLPLSSAPVLALAAPAALALAAPAALALAVPPAGWAQSPPAPVPAPPPLPGKARFELLGGLPTAKLRYYAPGQHVVVRGRVTPYVEGQALRLTVIRRGRVSKRIRRAVRADGRFRFRFKVGSPGLLRLVVKHARTDQQAAFRARARRIKVVRWNAGAGARGVHVLVLQRGLAKLGFATPVTGYFDGLTANAVNAFRKTNNIGRTGYASSSVYGMVLAGRGAFRLRYPEAGKHVEFDWSRQVLVLAKKRRPYRVYHVSSGAPATPTVFGSYRFYRQQYGTNASGMVHSSYFIGGYAIHGYPSVPNYPASHGCLRVPIPNAFAIFSWIKLGDRIFTYE
jgi:L,D-transpeptidase catalytic domain/Putative peptidoglycan binding domain